jgi:hypothetical protein
LNLTGFGFGKRWSRQRWHRFDMKGMPKMCRSFHNFSFDGVVGLLLKVEGDDAIRDHERERAVAEGRNADRREWCSGMEHSAGVWRPQYRRELMVRLGKVHGPAMAAIDRLVMNMRMTALAAYLALPPAQAEAVRCRLCPRRSRT